MHTYPRLQTDTGLASSFGQFHLDEVGALGGVKGLQEVGEANLEEDGVVGQALDAVVRKDLLLIRMVVVCGGCEGDVYGGRGMGDAIHTHTHTLR